MTTGINNAYSTYYKSPYLQDYNQSYVGAWNPTAAPAGQNTVFPQTAQPADKAEAKTKDGEKDDGKIGFWKAAGHAVKGVWNFLTSPFKNEKGEWSLKSTLKSVAIGVGLVALNCIPVVGQVLTPALLAYGFTKGAIGVGKAAYNIATAKTDAEDAAAWESLGSSAATVVASAVGAKAYSKASAANAARTSALESGATAAEADAAAAAAEAQFSGVRGTLKGVKNVYGETWQGVKTAGSAIKSGASNLASMTPAEIKTSLVDKYNAGVSRVKDSWQTIKTKSSGVYDRAKDVSIKDAVTEAYGSIKDMTIKDMAKRVVEIAKNNTNKYAPGIKDAVRTGAKNPFVLGTYSLLARTESKPAFYDMLSPEERQYFDTLTDDQKAQIEEAYYQAA